MAALVAGLIPFAVAVARAAVRHLIPVGDAAYYTVRSRDVATSHHPLVGAWSSGSSVVGVPVNNLGPLQLDLLAPFTHVTPYFGTALGSTIVNAGAVVLVWFAARRLVGPWRVVIVMAVTLVLVATLGLSWLIDARPQYALVLPLYALCWLVAAMAAGVDAAVPLAAGVASVVVQTHFTYVYPALLISAFGVVAFVVATRQRPNRQWGATARWSAVVVVVCWSQPLIDQVWGSGNLGEVLGPARRGQAGAGLRLGVQAVAGGVLIPPFWLPGSIGTFLAPYDGVSLALAIVALLAWLGVVAGLAWWAWRRRQPAVVALGATAAAALLAAVVGAALVPVSAFGLVPQNYYWLWAIGAFVTGATVVGVSSMTSVADRLATAVGARALRRTAALATVVVAAVAMWPRYPVVSVRYDEAEAARVGRPLRAQMAERFGSDTMPDPVEVDLSRAFFANNYPFVMLAELQRAGIEFRFVAGSRNLDRFGDSRCVEPGRLPRLVLVAGSEPSLVRRSEVLARVSALAATELAEYDTLQQRFGDRLRSGAMTVDVEAVADTFGDAAAAHLSDITTVLATTHQPATGLARSLDEWRRWGYVDVASDDGSDFARWFELERRSSADYQTVVLEPPRVDPTHADPDAAC